MHGLTVVDAYDLETGESVDCPITAEDFKRTIEWEEYAGRLGPERPNKEWADKVGGYIWSIGDGEGKEIKSGSTWEEFAQDA
jgi:hypothetical protein